jgi:beta-glucosidase/6-phospho-beta-glucosidase/beta-galactosidase
MCGKVDMEAVEHYKWILQTVKESNMRVMLTLFHHSLPKWALAYGGWIDARTVSYFEDFAR